MKKIYLLLAGIILINELGQAQLANPVNPGHDYTFIGKLQPRTTHEIVDSDLWIGGEVLDRDYANYHAYKHYLDSLGAKKIRLQSGWAKTEKVRGEYDFAWLDAIVDDALSRRIEPWIQISYGNDLYPGAGGISLGEGLPTSDEGMRAWLNYTLALVEHFRDRVTIWEIWNEADHRYNEAGPEAYANLYYKTAQVVREVQPAAQLVGLSLAAVGGKPEYVRTFFEYLKERNALYLIDAATFHGYPRNPDFSTIDKLKEVVYQYKPGLPLWQGETGCPSTEGSSGALSGYPWTELTQAKWNLRRAIYWVGNGHPFSLFTISEYNYDRQNFKGLNTKGILKINDDLSIAYAKPAYHAYQNLTSVLDIQMERLIGLDTKVVSDSSLSIYAYKHKLTNMPMVFVYQDGNIPFNENVTSKVTLQLIGLTFNEPVWVDMLSGEVYELPEGMYRKDKNTALFQNIPVYDSPVMITDRSLISIRN